jgi:hypothetical protein
MRHIKIIKESQEVDRLLRSVAKLLECRVNQVPERSRKLTEYMDNMEKIYKTLKRS